MESLVDFSSPTLSLTPDCDAYSDSLESNDSKHAAAPSIDSLDDATPMCFEAAAEWAPLSEPLLSQHVEDFLADPDLQTPVLVIDVPHVRQNYLELRNALPEANVYYAIKANPHPQVLRALVQLGSCFDVASPGEVDMVLAAGATPDRISYGNTIKKERDIAYAFSKGVRLFAYDSQPELEKLARAAPGARLFCRILVTDTGSAEWPLSRKFGCHPEMAEQLLVEAEKMGMKPIGISFHVGSQQTDLDSWSAPLETIGGIFKRNPNLTLVNLGGGLPARYTRNVPHMNEYGAAIRAALKRNFVTMPTLIVEPGRSMVGNAGVIASEVVLVSKKTYEEDAKRWVYLDLGLFSGLAETMGECIKYRMRSGTAEDQDKLGPVVLAGPTCDSADVMYQHSRFSMPLSLRAGDRVHILSTGAYTTTYSAVGFNGFAPLRAVAVDCDSAQEQVAEIRESLPCEAPRV